MRSCQVESRYTTPTKQTLQVESLLPKIMALQAIVFANMTLHLLRLQQLLPGMRVLASSRRSYYPFGSHYPLMISAQPQQDNYAFNILYTF